MINSNKCSNAVIDTTPPRCGDANETDGSATLAQRLTRHFKQPARTERPARIAGLGTSVIDIPVYPNEAKIVDHEFQFRIASDRFTVNYTGDLMRIGEKRYTSSSLDSFEKLPYTKPQCGGGIVHTAKFIGWLMRTRGLPVQVSFLDTAEPSAALQAECAKLNIGYDGLGLHRTLVNLTVTPASGPVQRSVLKSPVRPSTFTSEHAAKVHHMIGRQSDVLIINSPKSAQATGEAISTARRTGARICSVLTTALPMDFLQDVLLTESELAIAALSEFSPIAKSNGIPCPDDEATASIVEVAKAMVALNKQRKCGHLVVTLGPRGCVTAEANTGLVSHIGLRSEMRFVVQEKLMANRDRLTGVGDRFFGALVLALEFPFPQEESCGRLVKAARQASIDAVNSLSRFLAADKDSFCVSCIAPRAR